MNCPQLALDVIALPLQKQICSLGVILNPQLSLDHQVTPLAKGLLNSFTHQRGPFSGNHCHMKVGDDGDSSKI